MGVINGSNSSNKPGHDEFVEVAKNGELLTGSNKSSSSNPLPDNVDSEAQKRFSELLGQEVNSAAQSAAQSEPAQSGLPTPAASK